MPPDAQPDTGTNSDADAQPDAGTNSDADAQPDAGTNSDADAQPDAGTNSGTDAYTHGHIYFCYDRRGGRRRGTAHHGSCLLVLA
jgi:hypothetical protein